MSSLVSCNCSDPTCERLMCPACWSSDCKWPGECRGKCCECGNPAKPIPGLDGFYACHCSEECERVFWDRGIADGSIVALADLTPEQINEEFQKIGLALEGIGERAPS